MPRNKAKAADTSENDGVDEGLKEGLRKRKQPNKKDADQNVSNEEEPKRKRGKREPAKEKAVEKVEKKGRAVKKKVVGGDDSDQEKKPEIKTENEEEESKTKKKESAKGKRTRAAPVKKEAQVKVEKEESTTDGKETKGTSGKTSKKKKNAAMDEPVPRPAKYGSLGKGPEKLPSTGQKYMGCHVSGAGGLWLAFDNATECKAKSFALFLRNQRQWAAKALDDATIKKWKEAAEDMPPHLILPHGSYLMNLGSPNAETLEKSRNMLLEELQRCEKLGIPHYNFHPGSTTGLITREESCKHIAESINMAHKKTEGVICVLENMSCQGYTIGGDLHELRLIIENVDDTSRVGVCIDTCHTHAAGYDLSSKDGFDTFIEDFEKIIGWQFLRGLHINDSKGKVGDHKDRHENIGKGTIGIEGFRRIMNCEHFNDMPLILETPWTNNEGYAKEIKKLESLEK